MLLSAVNALLLIITTVNTVATMSITDDDCTNALAECTIPIIPHMHSMETLAYLRTYDTICPIFRDFESCIHASNCVKNSDLMADFTDATGYICSDQVIRVMTGKQADCVGGEALQGEIRRCINQVQQLSTNSSSIQHCRASRAAWLCLRKQQKCGREVGCVLAKWFHLITRRTLRREHDCVAESDTVATIICGSATTVHRLNNVQQFLSLIVSCSLTLVRRLLNP